MEPLHVQHITTEISVMAIPTTPIAGQKPGTSGLRKKVKVFQEPHYTANFIQSYFNALRRDNLSPHNILLVGGDGRYFTHEAIEIVCRISCANGVNELHLAKDGIMSTPACSAYIRLLNETKGNCLGGVLLTASHNPGGQHEDFGIKFNSRNGGPAQEQLTNSIYEETLKLSQYKSAYFKFLSVVDIAKVGQYHFTSVSRPEKKLFVIKVVENAEAYVSYMKTLFDFPLIQKLLDRPDFQMAFDAMYGAAGPYAQLLFQKELGNKVTLLHCDPKPDFNGTHPDPNLDCAKQLVHLLGVKGEGASAYDFGAACDGDADRNMILGKKTFVSPSDSLAVLASQSHLFLKKKLPGIARSMPTSGAVDKVAAKLGIKIYETPTGWKFFGNLMEEQLIGICGEESFGTGSPHIREKDGLWAILAWLQILATHNKTTQIGQLIGVAQILENHWRQFGRNYYCRYDYENCDTQQGTAVWNHILEQVPKYSEGPLRGSIFEYRDPVDGSFSKNQGVIFKYEDGSRTIFRQSGTGSVGITIRIYFEKYEEKLLGEDKLEVLKEMIDLGLQISQIEKITGKLNPDVVV